MSSGPDEAPPLPPAIGRYRITGRLGRDAEGEVFRALDPLSGRPVAIKLLSGQDAPEISSRVRDVFHREMQRAGGLSHPAIAMLIDAGHAPEGLFAASELVEGPNLSAWMAAHPDRDLPTAMRVVGQMADALEHAHQANFPHLNLKPGNVLVAGETVKVTGFGIARVLDTRCADVRDLSRVTPFTAPERIQARGGDSRADVYSLARLASDVLGGPERAGVDPAQWSGVFDRALADDPKARFASPGPFLAALIDALGVERVEGSNAWIRTGRATGAAAAAASDETAVFSGRRRPAAPPPDAPALPLSAPADEASEATVRVPRRAPPADAAAPPAAPVFERRPAPTVEPPPAPAAEPPPPAPPPAAAVPIPEPRPAPAPPPPPPPVPTPSVSAPRPEPAPAAPRPTVESPADRPLAARPSPPPVGPTAPRAPAARKPTTGIPMSVLAIAAVLLLAIGLGGWWLMRSPGPDDADVSATADPDAGVAPVETVEAPAQPSAQAEVEPPPPVAEVPTPAESPRAPARAAAPPRTGILRILSTPSGATVVIDEKPQGVTPLRVASLGLSDHSVRVSSEGYVTKEQTVRLTAARPSLTVELTLDAAAATPATGEVAITTEPQGATVTVDGNAVGMSPVTVRDVAAGNHVVRVTLDGFEAQSREVQVRAGETLDVQVRLAPVQAAAATSGPIPFDRVEVQPRQTQGSPSPPYPPAARMARVSGSVDLTWVVDENGEVTDVRVVEATSDLFEAEVLKWIARVRYTPGRQDGQPVQVRMQRRFNFRYER